MWGALELSCDVAVKVGKNVKNREKIERNSRKIEKVIGENDEHTYR